MCFARSFSVFLLAMSLLYLVLGKTPSVLVLFSFARLRPFPPLLRSVGGAGICNGPANFMGNPYMAIPIAITVEGANTLTRSLIIFGQGLTRSHPHLLDIIRSIQHGDDMKVRGSLITPPLLCSFCCRFSPIKLCTVETFYTTAKNDSISSLV